MRYNNKSCLTENINLKTAPSIKNYTMKKLLILSFTVILFTLSCSPKVSRVDESSTIDLSGRWNDTDSRLVASEMITDGLARPWLLDFVEANGRKPFIIVGLVQNKTSEHISTETFIKDIEREFLNSGKVKIVQASEAREQIRKEREDQQNNASGNTMKKFGIEKGADFILQGVVNSISDSNNKQKLMFYQTDLELTDLESNEKVWIGNKKIKKVVK